MKRGMLGDVGRIRGIGSIRRDRLRIEEIEIVEADVLIRNVQGSGEDVRELLIL